MATAAPAQFPHIVQDLEICSGRPRIAGTRVRVMDVVMAHQAGHSPQELADYFSSRRLTLGEVYAALAYYHDHQDEVDQAFAEDERLSHEVERQQREQGPNRTR